MIHIFHHNDADGYASAAVIIRELKEEINQGLNIKMYPCSHETPMDFNDVNPKNDKIFIVDYSFTNKVDIRNVEKMITGIEYITNESNIKDALKDKIVWIDHHASSESLINKSTLLKSLAEVGSVYPNNIYSGCMLTWLYFNYKGKIDDTDAIKYFITKKCPIWVRYVDDYDKWAMKIKHSFDFVTGVTANGLWKSFLDPEGSYSTYVSKNADGYTNKYIKKGKVINDYNRKKNMDDLKEKGFYTTIEWNENEKPLEILAINKIGNSSIFGDYIKTVDAVVAYGFTGKVWKYSIFSDESKTFPLDTIAKMFRDKYGLTGGGHKHAAGWCTDRCIFDDYKKIPFKDKNSI